MADVEQIILTGSYAVVVRFLKNNKLNHHVDEPIDEDKYPILFYACMRSDVKIVSLLVETYKADVNTKITVNEKGKKRIITPLRLAVERGNNNIIEYLILNGAEVPKSLPFFVINKGLSINIFHTLISRFKDPGELRGPEDKTLLMYAVEKKNKNYIMACVKFYRGREGIDYEDANGRTALFYAASVNNRNFIDILIDEDADKDHQDIYSNTYDHYFGKSLDSIKIEKPKPSFSRGSSRTSSSKRSSSRTSSKGSPGKRKIMD